jgi:TPR repeat protein
MWSSGSKVFGTLSRAGPLAAAMAMTTVGVASPINNCEAANKKMDKAAATNLVRKQTVLQQAVADDLKPPRQEQKPRRFNTKEELSKLRLDETKMLQRWDRDEEGWNTLPARAWPAYQPNPAELKGILVEVAKHGCTSSSSNTDLCKELLFNVATVRVFYNLDPEAGFQQYEELANGGHVDSMVACGIILVEGLGIPSQEEKGIEWLQKAVARDSAQASYELGTVLYIGIDGIVEEDSKAAFEFFQKAAEQDHTAALYMMADCLVEGDGTEINVAKAVPLFYRAAEHGHRFSRQRIRELLAKIEYQP